MCRVSFEQDEKGVTSLMAKTLKTIAYLIFVACMIPALAVLFCMGYVYEYCRMAAGAGKGYAEQDLAGNVSRQRERIAKAGLQQIIDLMEKHRKET